MTLQLPIDLLTVCSPLLGTGCRLLLKALPLLGGSDDATAAAATSGGGRCGELGWGCAEAAMTLLEAHKAAGGDRRPGRLAVEAALGLASLPTWKQGAQAALNAISQRSYSDKSIKTTV